MRVCVVCVYNMYACGICAWCVRASLCVEIYILAGVYALIVHLRVGYAG